MQKYETREIWISAELFLTWIFRLNRMICKNNVIRLVMKKQE